jgi:hypothetical protein
MLKAICIIRRYKFRKSTIKSEYRNHATKQEFNQLL